MTTLNLQVGASLDDSREDADTSTSPTSSSIRLNETDSWGGFRFQNVTIPQGSTINSADFQYYIEDVDHDDVNHVIYCEDADTSAQFSASSSDISGRAQTTASVHEVQLAAGAGWRSAPDISALIQEVVDRPSWASGNALSVLVRGNYDSAPFCYVESYDGNSAQAAKLDIDYTAPSAGGQPMALRGQAVPGVRGAWSGKCIGG
jgi:hypothetical protein